MFGLEELGTAAIGEVVERSLVSPGGKQENVCQLTSRGVFQHGMLGDRRAEARPGSGAGWKERGQAARSALEAACGVV